MRKPHSYLDCVIVKLLSSDSWPNIPQCFYSPVLQKANNPGHDTLADCKEPQLSEKETRRLLGLQKEFHLFDLDVDA